MNTQTPINTRAAWRPVLRPLAHLLIAAQLALTLQPLSAIAQDKGATPYNPQAQAQLQRLGELNQRMEQAKAQKAKAARSPADQVSEKLARTEELVKGIRQDKDARDNRRTERRTQRLNELKEQLQGVEAGVADVRSEFEATGQELKRMNLPAEIIQRHQQAQADFEQRATDYKKIAARLNKQQPDETAIEELDAFFKKHPASRRHTPLNPGKLPWGAPKATPRMPAETKAAWHQSLSRSHKVQLAQAGNLTTIGGVRFSFPPEPGQAPTDADLAATPDIQLTPAIRAKAAELGHNPVAIHNWMRNTVQWLPTWGSIQGADGTLKTLRGNAIDTASLTMALLRASGIPARYQFGTIDVPAEQAQNWVGGVSQPEAALNLLYQGGIAARGIASAGRIRTIRMEHVWVSAYVNWLPSRGAKDGGWDLTPKQHPSPNAQLNAWVPLDVSYKQYVYTPGMNLQANVPLDAAALLAAVQQGATVTPHYTQNLNQANLQAQLASHQNQIKAYINSTPGGASATVGDVLGSQRILPRNFSMLPGTLAHPLVVLGNQRAELPDEMRWKVALNLHQNANDVPNVNVELPMAQLDGKRLAISYEPATPQDRQLIDAAAQSGQTSFSAYLVRHVPKIKLDLDVLGTGFAQQPGTVGRLNITLKGPAGEISREYQVTSGDTAVLALNAAGTDANKYVERARDYALNELDMARYGLQGLAEEMLHQIGLAWWAQKYAAQDNMAAVMGVVQHALPSHALTIAPVSVRYFFGVPRSASYKSRAMDAKLDYVMVEHKDGNQAMRKEFVRAAGQFGSYMEGAIFDQAFNPLNQTGISTISLIGRAQAQGVNIYKLKPGDEGLASQLQTSAAVKEEIVAALAYGREVTVPEQDITLGGYTGLGYIIEDPADGSAAYQIDGGRSGGQAEASENVVPIPQMPDSQLIGILLGGMLRQSGAKLAVDAGGMVVGLVLPSVAVSGAALGALLGLLIMLIMLAQNLSKLFEQTYPLDTTGGTRWRKYTKYQDFIFARWLLYASNTGTFGGGGVYVADAYAEEHRGVNCATMSPVDIATRFQIPNATEPRPSDITGFVDIIELRKGYLKLKQVGPNTAGQLEYLITKPIIVVPELRDIPGASAIALALVLTPGVVEIDNVCTIR